MINPIARILDWCLQPACPWCGTRTPDIEAHIQGYEHAGDNLGETP